MGCEFGTEGIYSVTFEEFEVYQNKLVNAIYDLGQAKGKEYAHSANRFANFNRLSEELGIPNYVIGWIYCKKHLDSIASFIKEGQTFSTETIQSRFQDAILYLMLIGGMVEECSATSAQQNKNHQT